MMSLNFLAPLFGGVLLVLSSMAISAENSWKGFDTQALTIEGSGLSDLDKDGVIDGRDNCNGNASDAVISNDGCPEKKDVLAKMALNINFKSDDWHILPKYYKELEQFVQFYQQHRTGFITIEAYTDSTASASHNLKLSQLRAQAVVKQLTNTYGIDSAKINWVGYGEMHPIATNETAEGRDKNRRIVAVIRANEWKSIRQWRLDN